MSTSRDAWEKVLLAVEAEARQAELLLNTPAEQFVPPADRAFPDADRAQPPPDRASTGLPADWLIPVSAELPPLDSMPPVPAELSDRILGLRAEITRLQSELADAMRDMPRSGSSRMVAVTTVQSPSYIDRRL